MLLQHGLLVFDIGFNRIPRASFQRALVRNGRKAIAGEDSVGARCGGGCVVGKERRNRPKFSPSGSAAV